MATVQRIFDTLDTSSFLDGGSSASVTNAGQDSEFIDISQWEAAHCFVEADFPGAPTDDLEIKVLSSNDGLNYDSIPLFSFTVDNGNESDSVSFIVPSVYGFKINFAASGATDAISVILRYRRWRWETV